MNKNIRNALKVLKEEADRIKAQDPTATNTTVAIKMAGGYTNAQYKIFALLLNEIEV